MIPLPNREKLIRLLNEGMDIRAACVEATITRSNLYKYFKQFPAFRDEVDGILRKQLIKIEQDKKKAEEDNLRKIKEIIMRRK